VAVASVLVALALAAGVAWWWVSLPARRIARAEAAAKAGDFATALAAWRAVNASGPPRASYLKAEARAALALGRAAEADRALARASDVDPSDPEPWRLRLERLRVLDMPLEAQALGWPAYAAVPPDDRPGVLRDLTLALLAELPEDLARTTLARWADAAPDPDARVALLLRGASMPRPGDPDRASRVAELTRMLDAEPSRLSVREALVSALLDGGDLDRARRALGEWPGAEPGRDARYWRLRGRFDLDYDRRPGPAVDALTRALADLPHDWKTRARLARALHALGRNADARREAEAVNRTRESLDPARLGPRLSADFEHIAEPSALLDLASLCDHAGLARLAEAWRREAASRPPGRS